MLHSKMNKPIFRLKKKYFYNQTFISKKLHCLYDFKPKNFKTPEKADIIGK